MKILFDTSPLHTGHAIRGVGFYVQNLKKSLLEYDKKNTYEFLESTKNISAQFDILHIPYFDPFFIHLPLIKKSKLIVTVHDLTPLVLPELFPIGKKGRLKWELNKQLLKRADAIITDSNSSKDDINRLTGIPQEKIHTVYLAAGEEFKQLNLPTTKNQQLRTKYNLPSQFVLYVGDVTANKNLPKLLDAIKKTNHTLVLVGKALANYEYDSTNPWNKDLVHIHKRVKDDPQFKVLGFVDQEDLVALYNSATAAILPSLYEGFGLPVLEAMQSGCPVITSKNGSLSEVADAAAYYVEASNVDSIAKGINDVMSNSQLQKSLIEKGLIQAEKFNWQTTAEETVKVYEQVGH